MVEINIKLNCPDIFKKRAAFILNLMGSATKLRFRHVDSNPDIVYGEPGDKFKLHVPHIQYEFDDEEWQLFDSRSRLILPGFMQRESLTVNEKKLGIDLFALAYMFLVEGMSKKNQLRWAPGKINTGLRHIYPFFNSYIDLFIDALKSSEILPSDYLRESPWPADAPFAVGLSHDLDIFKRKILGGLWILANSLFGNSLPGGLSASFKGLGHSIRALFTSNPNPYNQFAKWLATEEMATYFIFAGKRGSSKDPTYKPAHVVKQLTRDNISILEVGLHNGTGTSDKIEELSKNKQLLSELFGQEIKGIRPHYLDFALPDFWRNAWDFAYSSSIGSDTIPGFTCGINLPFHGFDFNSGDIFDILEMPLGVMDCALLAIKDKVLRERTIDEIINNCKSSFGMLVLDWHVRTAYDTDYPEWLDIYKTILTKANEHGAYITSLGEIDRYWRQSCESAFLS